MLFSLPNEDIVKDYVGEVIDAELDWDLKHFYTYASTVLKRTLRFLKKSSEAAE